MYYCITYIHTYICTAKLVTPDGLAIDWISKKMCWADTGTNTLEHSDLFGCSRRILLNDTDEPREIALDSMNDMFCA